ncbi:putative phage abortive infection protein [Chitinophaga silvisoli]|uniref:Phage abortive infection protein n=1 Tax=Chitinophaga silvisoli TaxID=2291814 RepID=A0A3E1NTG5_9BACT|nr:putative phage abortive infection protein [Chitinophaga silvisoli]RFM31231.1 hypothetical protein DXN04_29310 [Chitinophaga silvisoli]
MKTVINSLISFVKKHWAEILVTICILACIITILAYWINFRHEKISNLTANWGTFGDYTGGIMGTIISFFSIVLIYATYKNQVDNSLLQQFETTFFNLLNNQRAILTSLKGEFRQDILLDDSIEANGEDYMVNIGRLINRYFDGGHNYIFTENNIEVKRDSDDILELEQIVNGRYKSVFKGREGELGHYFRHLYHIFKYVHESKITDKKKYIDLIQAQMSDYELYVLLYNSLSDYGKTKFKPMLIEYVFFENVRSRGPLFDKHKRAFFPQIEFKFNAE